MFHGPREASNHNGKNPDYGRKGIETHQRPGCDRSAVRSQYGTRVVPAHTHEVFLLGTRISTNTIMANIAYHYLQRWAKVTTLRALTIFLEALFQLEKRLGEWTVGLTVKKVNILFCMF
jgi:hypothetical protein